MAKTTVEYNFAIGKKSKVNLAMTKLKWIQRKY